MAKLFTSKQEMRNVSKKENGVKVRQLTSMSIYQGVKLRLVNKIITKLVKFQLDSYCTRIQVKS